MPDDAPQWSLRWEPASVRQLKKLPRAVQPRLVALAEALRNNPRPSGVVKLSDERHASGNALYRARSGDYRLVYTLENEHLVVVVVAVGDRKEVYR